MINARMGAESKLLIQEMITDLWEMWHNIDRDPGPHRGGITGAGMQTDFLRYKQGGELWDAHVMIKQAKVAQQMVMSSHEEHNARRWAVDDRGNTAGAQEPQPAVYNEWPRRYR